MRKFLKSLLAGFDSFVSLVLRPLGFVFWHFSRFVTRWKFAWYIYQKTAGPEGWLWGRYLLTTLWVFYMCYAVFVMLPVVDVGLPFWLGSLLVMLFGLMVVIPPLMLKYKIRRSKPKILQFIKKLENARR